MSRQDNNPHIVSLFNVTFSVHSRRFLFTDNDMKDNVFSSGNISFRDKKSISPKPLSYYLEILLMFMHDLVLGGSLSPAQDDWIYGHKVTLLTRLFPVTSSKEWLWVSGNTGVWFLIFRSMEMPHPCGRSVWSIRATLRSLSDCVLDAMLDNIKNWFHSISPWGCQFSLRMC